MLYPETYTRGARRFDSAGIAKSFLPNLALPALRQVLLWRPDRVRDRLRALVADLGSHVPPERRSASDPNYGPTHILGINFEEPALAAAAAIGASNIRISLRGATLRVSPHLWNTTEELALLGAALSAAVR